MPGSTAQERLFGAQIPALRLASTVGGEEDLAALACGHLVIYMFPGTGIAPTNSRDPDGLLGSGCTVQSQAFAELTLDFAARGVKIVGISSIAAEDQLQFAMREGLPFSLLSDARFKLATALGLPTVQTRAGKVYDRLTIMASEGVIRRAFHPVQIPRSNALDVLHWLERSS